MAFEVETGAGSHTATSFCSVAYADTHHAKDKRTAATWAALSTANKQYRLETASEIICRDSTFAGVPTKLIGLVSGKQRLQWPRFDVYDRNGQAIASDEIPEDLQRATAQLAGELELKDLDKEPTRGVTSFSVGQGAFSTTLDPSKEPRVIVRSVLNYLRPYLAMSGAFGKAVR